MNNLYPKGHKKVTSKIIFSKKGVASLFQVFILVLGIIAIGYALGSEVGVLMFVLLIMKGGAKL